jgi:hypothetical protein
MNDRNDLAMRPTAIMKHYFTRAFPRPSLVGNPSSIGSAPGWRQDKRSFEGKGSLWGTSVGLISSHSRTILSLSPFPIFPHSISIAYLPRIFEGNEFSRDPCRPSCKLNLSRRGGAWN